MEVYEILSFLVSFPLLSLFLYFWHPTQSKKKRKQRSQNNADTEFFYINCRTQKLQNPGLWDSPHFKLIFIIVKICTDICFTFGTKHQYDEFRSEILLSKKYKILVSPFPLTFFLKVKHKDPLKNNIYELPVTGKLFPIV